MIKFKCKIKNINKLDNKLQTISNKLAESVMEGVKKASENTCKYAIRLRRGNKNDGIEVEMFDIESGKIKSRIHTNQETFPYSWFEHYGTGRYAELPHIGTTKHFLESGYEQWFIPFEKVDRPLNYPIIEIQGSKFYLAHGVKPNPFLQKAEFERRFDNLEDIQKEIQKMLKEVCK